MQGFATYLRTLAVSALLMALAVLGIIVVVDPYGLIGHGLVSGAKPQAYNQKAAAKAARFERAKPISLFIGNSRVDVGIDPDMLPERLKPAFNYGIPGESILKSSLRLPDLLDSQRDIRHVYVMLDFFDFIGPDQHGPFLPPETADTLTLWFSTSALTDALTTLGGRGKTYADNMRADGFHPPAAYEGLFAREGREPSYRLNNAKVKGQLHRSQGRLSHMPDGRPLIAFIVETTVNTAAAHGATVTFLVPPYHASIMSLIEEEGLMPLYRAWQQQVEAAVAGTPVQNNVALWDFSGRWWLTEEPPARDTPPAYRPTYYYEPGHFRPTAGQVIMDMTEGKKAPYKVPGCDRCFRVATQNP